MKKFLIIVAIVFSILGVGTYLLVTNLIRVETNEKGESKVSLLGGMIKVDESKDSVSIMGNMIQVDGENQTVKIGEEVFVDGINQTVRIGEGEILIDGKSKTTRIKKDWVLEVKEDHVTLDRKIMMAKYSEKLKNSYQFLKIEEDGDELRIDGTFDREEGGYLYLSTPQSDVNIEINVGK